MKKPFKICDRVYQIGGAEISHPYDCSVYLVDAGELMVIDSGAGMSYEKLIDGIEALGFKPKDVSKVIVTHHHIDHVGALHNFKDDLKAEIIAHEKDLKGIESGVGIGADFYQVDYVPCTVDTKLEGDSGLIQAGDFLFNWMHIPGHTQGSIAVYIQVDGKKVLFGQDIHGPYNPAWGADPAKAKKSLQKLIDLNADILCEGHFGIVKSTDNIESFIHDYMDEL
jgi:glyoxylase-like metal-dependent hydrolase (beta-lactamase superfamily II)